MAIIAFASSSKKACVVKLLQNSCLSLLSQKKYAKKIFYAKFKKKVPSKLCHIEIPKYRGQRV